MGLSARRLAGVLATSVIFTWFYTKSGFSTFIIILLHTTSNFCLFLILRSFTHGGDTSALQTIYNVIVVAVALAAAISLRRATSKESVAATPSCARTANLSRPGSSQKTLQPRQPAMYPLLLTRLSDVTFRARWTS
jgi:hypothetical protein